MNNANYLKMVPSPRSFEARLPPWSLVAATLVAAVLGVTVGAQELRQDATGIPHRGDGQGLPVFTGALDVNLVDLYVTVVDAEGNPVSGLGRDDFVVWEDGEQRQITNFQALSAEEAADPAVREVVTDASGPGPEGKPAAESAAEDRQGVDQRYVAVLLDSPSLERRNRNRVLAALEGFVRDGVARDDMFLFAANDGELRILSNFNRYEPSVLATLRRAAELPTTGEAHKLSRRYLKRTVYQTELFRMARNLPGQQDTAYDEDWTRVQGRSLLYQINALRQYEAERIRQSLSVVEELVRSLAGIEGRKSVLWVGEDLAIRPALDIYTAFYKNAAFASQLLGLNRPEVWGEEVNLKKEFQNLVATAQACGATLFVIDTSDRDREAGNADFSPPTGDTAIAAEAGGQAAWTPGMNLAEVRDLTEGAQYAALSTGGTAYNAGRNLDQAMEGVQRQVATYYYLGYRRPGPPDGKRHRVQVEVAGERLRVRHHERVLDRTPPQRLVDLAMSRLRLDMGLNPLGLELALGGVEPSDADRVIQELRLSMPVGRLVLLPSEDSMAGQILVAVAVIDEDGQTAPPQLLRLHLLLPPEQLGDDTFATQTIRLLMKPGTRRIAVSVRDEVSGIEGSQAISMPGSDT